MKAIVFGCGKIARGFVGQLLFQSGFQITFVDVNKLLVESLNRAGKYYVNVMGEEKKSQWISNFHCLTLDDVDAIAEELVTADIAFTAVGGKNLKSLGSAIASAYQKIEHRMNNRALTIITCENWKNPARELEQIILDNLAGSNCASSFCKHIGVSEAAVLRSGVEATEEIRKIDTYAVSVTSYWELPVNEDRIVGAPVHVQGIRYQKDFDTFLQRKIYTFNTTNATIAYIGILKGYQLLKDAANDPEIVELVEEVHKEINPAIAAQLNADMEDQIAFSQKALKKYQDKSVADFLERHARDPLRKLGPEDRIVGVIRLVERQGISYTGLATTLAAAIFYPLQNESDESAVELENMRKEHGVLYVLKKVCGIDNDEKIAQIVQERVDWLRKKGWLHE